MSSAGVQVSLLPAAGPCVRDLAGSGNIEAQTDSIKRDLWRAWHPIRWRSMGHTVLRNDSKVCVCVCVFRQRALNCCRKGQKSEVNKAWFA